MTTKIYKSSGDNVSIYLPSKLMKLINTKKIIIKEVGNEVHIREAVFTDNTVWSISKYRKGCGSAQVAYNSVNANSLIGEYNVEQEGDYFILWKD